MRRKLLAAALASALVAGCGGGGGSDAPATTFNMEAALASAFGTGVTFNNLTTTYNGVTLNMTLAYAPVPDAPFYGTSRKRVSETVSVRYGGGAPVTETGYYFYTANPTRVVGTTNPPSAVSVSTMVTDLPTAGTVGAGGTYVTTKDYSSEASTVVVGTSQTAWSLEADTGATAWACLTSTSTSGESYMQKQCFRINSAGAISGAKVTVTLDGVTLNFQ